MNLLLLTPEIQEAMLDLPPVTSDQWPGPDHRAGVAAPHRRTLLEAPGPVLEGERTVSETPFYKTRMGQQFYDRTVPDLVQQLQRLNETLERLATLLDRQDDENKPCRT